MDWIDARMEAIKAQQEEDEEGEGNSKKKNEVTIFALSFVNVVTNADFRIQTPKHPLRRLHQP